MHPLSARYIVKANRRFMRHHNKRIRWLSEESENNTMALTQRNTPFIGDCIPHLLRKTAWQTALRYLLHSALLNLQISQLGTS